MTPPQRTVLIASFAVLALAAALLAVAFVVSRDDDPVVAAGPGASAAPTPSPNAVATAPSASAAPPPPVATPTATEGETESGQARCQGELPAGGEVTDAGVGDVDGDGADDTLLLAMPPDGELSLHLLGTSIGQTDGYRFSTASPIISAGTAQADGEGAPEIFIGVRGRAGQNWRMVRLDGCSLREVRNVQGEPYTFEVGVDPDGGDRLSGLGCVDVDGDDDLELVGTAAVLEGEEYRVERTVVEVSGDEARNGDTDVVRVPADDQQSVDTLSGASCGEEFLAQDDFN